MRENAHLSLSPINRRPHIAQKRKPPQVSPRRLSPQRLFVGIGIGIDRLTMLMTGEFFIQEVLFFPQMRPEKVIPKDAPARYTELGIPEDWVAVIQKAGSNLVSDMKDVNPQKHHMDICGINKKYKLELANPTVNEVADWVGRIKN